MVKNKTCKVGLDWSYIILRIGFGMFFFFSGLPKIMALIGGTNPLGGFNIPMWLAWIVAIVEALGGVFLVLGLFSFEAGVLIAFVMLVAVIMTTVGGFNAKSFFQHILYIGGALVLAFSKNRFLAIESLWRKK